MFRRGATCLSRTELTRDQPMGSTLHAKQRSSHLGLTRMELLVVLIVIGSFAALTLLGIGSAREAARRMQCSNHLKQIGLALQNYHDVFQSLPYGARARCVSTTTANTCIPTTMQQGFGPSWLMGILPFQAPLNAIRPTASGELESKGNCPLARGYSAAWARLGSDATAAKCPIIAIF